METSFSLPAIMEREIDALIRAYYYSSISETAKDAFRTLLETKSALKLASSIEMYKSEDVSISKSAELAGMNLEDYKRILSERGIRER